MLDLQWMLRELDSDVLVPDSGMGGYEGCHEADAFLILENLNFNATRPEKSLVYVKCLILAYDNRWNLI